MLSAIASRRSILFWRIKQPKFIAVILLLFCSLQWAEEPDLMAHSPIHDQTIKSCAYLLDKTFILQPQDAFQLLKKTAPRKLPYNGGYDKSALWLYVKLFSPAGCSSNRWVLHLQSPLMDTVNVYYVNSDTLKLYTQAGRLQKKRWPAINGIEPALVIPRFEKDSLGLVIHCKTHDVLAVSLYLKELGLYQEQYKNSNILYGIYFGAVILTMLLNLALYFTANYQTCFWYSMYVGTFGLFQAFSLNLIKPTNIESSWLFNMLLPFCAGLCIFSGSLFTKLFLELNKRSLFRHALVFSSILGLSISILAPLDAGRIASIWTSIIAPLFVILIPVIAALQIKKIPRPALFLCTGTIFLALSILLNTFKNFGILSVNALTVYGIIIGSAIEFTILAVALVDRIRVLTKQKISVVERLEKIERMAVESKLKLLQSQINPHFLFNTLNTIAELTSADPEKAETVILQLSNFFRYTLTASQTPLIRLEEEIAIARTYLDIQKVRFGARLNYEIKVDGELTDVLSVGMTLQPVVENAVKFGIISSNEGGKISIQCTVTNDNVEIKVSDTGLGFGQNVCNNDGTKHGLQSVKERLSLSFGKEARLNCFNNNGAVVVMTFPRRTSNEVQSYNCR